MSRPVSKTAVGVFVVAFFVLLFACIVFFGGISLGRESTQYVIYLKDSVSGLEVGSAVRFKGVRVGSVKSVMLDFEGQKEDELAIPVVIEIFRNKKTAAAPTEALSDEKLAAAIDAGLRAHIQSTSIVTGLLHIDIDFFPGTPVVLHGNVDHIDLPEIPTIPSTSSQLMQTVTKILEDLSAADFSALSAQLRRTLARLEEGLGEIEFKKINDGIVRLSDSAATILEDPELKRLPENINGLIRDVDALSAAVAGQVDPVSEELRRSLAELRATLNDVGAAVALFQGAFTTEAGTVGGELSEALVQINDAARAVRALAEYLQVGLLSGAAPEPEK